MLNATKTLLPKNLTARPTTMDDAEAVFELTQLHMLENFGKSNQTLEELKSEWDAPKFDVSKNTLSVYTEDSKLVGYASVWDTREVPVRPWTWGYVHPNYRRQGIGTYLLQWMEQRARQVIDRVPEHARVVMQADCLDTDKANIKLFESQGMVSERSSWDMLIEMDAEPEAPVWPEGITLTSMAELDDLTAVYRAFVDSFQDHRGHVEESEEVGLERFRHWISTDPNYDPSLWFAAMDGDKIAALSLCQEKSWDDAESGYVNVLGVIRDYRRKGLGLAILQHSFVEFWKRGQRKASLGVDATSLTGATRLYEKAGMRIHYRFDFYEKELRPGEELSNQG